MTVMIYEEVRGVVDSIPRTKENITDILTDGKGMYECDKAAYSRKVYKALKQLMDEGKIKLEYRIRGETIAPCYVINDGRPPKMEMSRAEEIYNAMVPGEWYSCKQLVEIMYGTDPVRYSTMCSRVSRALYTLQNKGMVFKKKVQHGRCSNVWTVVA